MKRLLSLLVLTGFMTSVASADPLNAKTQSTATAGLKSVPVNYMVEVTWENNWDGPVQFQWMGYNGVAGKRETIAQGSSFKGVGYAGSVYVFYLMEKNGTDVFVSYPFMVPMDFPKRTIKIAFPKLGRSPINGPFSEQGMYLYRDQNNNMVRFSTIVHEFSGGGFGSSVGRYPGGFGRLWKKEVISFAQGMPQTLSTVWLTETGRSADAVFVQNTQTREKYVLSKGKPAVRRAADWKTIVETYQKTN